MQSILFSAQTVYVQTALCSNCIVWLKKSINLVVRLAWQQTRVHSWSNIESLLLYFQYWLAFIVLNVLEEKKGCNTSYRLKWLKTNNKHSHHIAISFIWYIFDLFINSVLYFFLFSEIFCLILLLLYAEIFFEFLITVHIFNTWKSFFVCHASVVLLSFDLIYWFWCFKEEKNKTNKTMLWHILVLLIRIQQMYGHRTAYVYIVFY